MEEIRKIVNELNASGFSNNELRSLVNALSYNCEWNLAKELIEREINHLEDFYRPLLGKVEGISDENKEKVGKVVEFILKNRKAILNGILPI